MAEKKIGSRTFRADKLPATQATSLMFRLGKVVGPALGSLAGASSIKDLAALAGDESQNTKVLTLVGDLFGNLDPVVAQNLLVELCELAKVQAPGGNYENVIFDATFDTSVADAFKVAAFVVQVNFGDFFAAAPRGA